MNSSSDLTAAGRYVILSAAFLGWMFSGFQMAVMTLASRSATTEFLRRGQLSASEPFSVRRLVAKPSLTVGGASTGKMPVPPGREMRAILAQRLL